MKTKEELNSIKEEVEALNKKLCELTNDELIQVVGGWQVSGDMSSEDVYRVMFMYITEQDEFRAVWLYRSKGYILNAADSAKAHNLFSQIFGHEIEQSQYFE